VWESHHYLATNCGLRSMYFVVMSRVSLIVILVMYVCYLYSINCPTVICLSNMLYLSYGETPLVNCGPRSNFLYIVILFLMRVNSTNVLDEGLMIGETGRQMNSKVNLVKQGVYRK
jgi:hypothetical protein